MRMRSVIAAVALGFMVVLQSACGTLATSPPPNAQVAEQIHLRAVQGMIAAELAFSLASVTVEAITPSLTPAQAAQVQTQYRQAHTLLLAGRAAKAAGDDAAAILRSQELTAALNALNALIPHRSGP